MKFKRVIINIFFIVFALISTAHATDVFNFKLDNTQFLNYNQKRSLSIINYLLSKYIKPDKIVNYNIEIDDTGRRETSSKLSVSKSSIIFYGNPVTILNDKENFSQLTISIISNLIDNENLEFNNQYYEWIITAINRRYQLYNNENNIPFRGTFPCVHYLLMSGKRLSPKSIINSNLYKSYNTGYEIYSEECEVLLNTIADLNKGKNIITNYLKAIGNAPVNSQPYQLFEKTFEGVKNGISINALQKHLDQTAFFYSVNYYMPAKPKFCLKQFKKIEFITYTDKDNDKKFKCSLDNLARNINKMKNPNTVLKNLSAELKNMQMYFPFYMNTPIQNLDKLILQLKSNINNNFTAEEQEGIRKKLKLEIKKIYKGATKQQQLNQLLDKLEIKTNRTEKLFNKYFIVINKNNEIEKKFWPELNEYLDEINNQFY